MSPCNATMFPAVTGHRNVDLPNLRLMHGNTLHSLSSEIPPSHTNADGHHSPHRPTGDLSSHTAALAIALPISPT